VVPDTSLSKRDLFLFAALFLLESSIAAMAMLMHRKGERLFAVFLSSRPGIAFLIAIAAFFIAGWVIVHQYHLASQWARLHHFRLNVAMNLVTVLLILITGEIIVRVGSQSSQDKEVFGNVVLKPRNWERTKLRYRQLFEKGLADHSLLVYDDRLGWAVGQNRYGAPKGEGPYWSSSEGLRAPHKGVAFPKVEGKTEIALVGDSFTFGDEVRYEETWGYKLEQLLGEEFQVLNFGVPGYGLGQMYLRYEKAVRQRSPKVVVFGFISEDVSRTMWVYPFLSTDWNLPFSTPRFMLRDGEPTNVNMRPLPSEAIFSRGSISELPFVEYDSWYRPSDWQKRWYHFSYLVRLYISLYPSWAENPETLEEEVRSINAAILKTFVRSVKQAGSNPHVLFFPGRSELKEPSSHLSLGKRVLEQAGVAYIDPTPCLLEVDPADRFLEGHYSPQGNAAVAKCVYKAVKESLAQASGTGA
jgi:hypothetical protein